MCEDFVSYNYDYCDYFGYKSYDLQNSNEDNGDYDWCDNPYDENECEEENDNDDELEDELYLKDFLTCIINRIKYELIENNLDIDYENENIDDTQMEDEGYSSN